MAISPLSCAQPRRGERRGKSMRLSQRARPAARSPFFFSTAITNPRISVENKPSSIKISCREFEPLQGVPRRLDSRCGAGSMSQTASPRMSPSLTISTRWTLAFLSPKRAADRIMKAPLWDVELGQKVPSRGPGALQPQGEILLQIRCRYDKRKFMIQFSIVLTAATQGATPASCFDELGAPNIVADRQGIGSD
jgi:hypothetical protein